MVYIVDYIQWMSKHCTHKCSMTNFGFSLGLDKINYSFSAYYLCLLKLPIIPPKFAYYSAIFSLIVSKFICDCGSLALPATVRTKESCSRSRSVLSSIYALRLRVRLHEDNRHVIKGERSYAHQQYLIRPPIILDDSLLFTLAYYSTNFMPE